MFHRSVERETGTPIKKATDMPGVHLAEIAREKPRIMNRRCSIVYKRWPFSSN